MKLNRLFSRFKGKRNDDNIPEDDCHEIAITSEEPYKMATDVTDGVEQTRTFTEHWEMQTENMKNSISGSVKVIYDDCDLLQLDLYLPDAVTYRNMSNLTERQLPDLWLFLDNGEFFIFFPEEIDLSLDEKQFITRFRINLCNAGFHSKMKKLKDVLPHQEICDIVRKKLTEHDIVEIEPKILTDSDDAPECPTVTVLSPTASTLKKAFKAVCK